jgi:hypothetical protein
LLRFTDLMLIGYAQDAFGTVPEKTCPVPRPPAATLRG